MYAFTPALRAAWARLFSHLPRCLLEHGVELGVESGTGGVEVSFRTDPAVYRAPHLLLGQTCGYPYRKQWAATHQVVCVAAFAVHGCAQTQYSSCFITPANGGVADLASARGKRAAVNHPDSHSGMNALRHAIAGLAGGRPFFSEVLISRSHAASIDLVARGRVELAAIDAVTCALHREHAPGLHRRIRIIGQSAPATALPFIAPAATTARVRTGIISALNASLRALGDHRGELHALSGFQAVSAADYAAIGEMERFAVQRGYPNLA
ncbi:MAG: PhnD/SsuA/transferrin family substrate-binding protein [Gammaproteobacteria bacterium]|nr:PhnD/SsuA/transferrin family substrate-binding protein [Gammaproteobacteria bacterium]